MQELISVVAFFAGIPLFIVGWVMSINAASKLNTQWGTWYDIRFSNHSNDDVFNPLAACKETFTGYYYWYSINTGHTVLHT